MSAYIRRLSVVSCFHHLAGKTGLRLAIFDGRKFAHSSFCGCTLQPTCNKLNSEGTEHPPPPFPPA